MLKRVLTVSFVSRTIIRATAQFQTQLKLLFPTVWIFLRLLKSQHRKMVQSSMLVNQLKSLHLQVMKTEQLVVSVFTTEVIFWKMSLKLLILTQLPMLKRVLTVSFVSRTIIRATAQFQTQLKLLFPTVWIFLRLLKSQHRKMVQSLMLVNQLKSLHLQMTKTEQLAVSASTTVMNCWMK